MSAIGIIGGTGVYDPSIFENIHEESLMTPYGEIDYVQGTYHGKTVIFVARHGKDHTIPPHKINYRANIWGLKKLGVTFIISTTAVGSLNENFKPGHFVLTDQFLDFTKNRITTFYEGGDRPVAHLDVTNPYCPELRDILQKVGTEQGLTIHNGGTYVCTEGPRFETPAEIKMFHMLGGDTVGMKMCIRDSSLPLKACTTGACKRFANSTTSSCAPSQPAPQKRVMRSPFSK